MTLSIRINEKSKAGKSVLAMIKLLAEKETLTVIEEVEDKRMSRLICSRSEKWPDLSQRTIP